jgi:hypothetical protein
MAACRWLSANAGKRCDASIFRKELSTAKFEPGLYEAFHTFTRSGVMEIDFSQERASACPRCWEGVEITLFIGTDRRHQRATFDVRSTK